MSDENIENIIQEKGLTAPRLTPSLISSKIKDVAYHVFEGSCVTVCCITLENGHTVTGEFACVCPANFNKNLGEENAFKKAKEKIWDIEVYLLKQRLYEANKQKDLSNNIAYFMVRNRHNILYKYNKTTELVTWVDNGTNGSTVYPIDIFNEYIDNGVWILCDELGVIIE